MNTEWELQGDGESAPSDWIKGMQSNGTECMFRRGQITKIIRVNDQLNVSLAGGSSATFSGAEAKRIGELISD